MKSTVSSTYRDLARFVFTLLLFTLFGVSSSSAQSPAGGDEPHPFQEWTLSGDARLVGGADDGMLHIDTGVAGAPIPALRDGTIEFEVMVSDARSFAYVQFRVVDAARQREEIYIRPHKSNLPDALQYTPVIENTSQWQLFWGADGTTSVPLPATAWIPVRLEFQGRMLAVFIGDTNTPVMVIPRMALEPRAGGVAFRSFIPRGSHAPFGARFRNFRASDTTTFDFASVSEPESAKSGTIVSWLASPPFEAQAKLVDQLPEVDEDSFEQPVVEPNGFLLLHRVGKARARINGYVVRLKIDAARAERRILDLGFSDAASIFLNGSAIASADQSYLFENPQRQGLMGTHQLRLFLDLAEGANTLDVVVTDSFGGAGIVGRWVSED